MGIGKKVLFDIWLRFRLGLLQSADPKSGSVLYRSLQKSDLVIFYVLTPQLTLPTPLQLSCISFLLDCISCHVFCQMSSFPQTFPYTQAPLLPWKSFHCPLRPFIPCSRTITLFSFPMDFPSLILDLHHRHFTPAYIYHACSDDHEVRYWKVRYSGKEHMREGVKWEGILISTRCKSTSELPPGLFSNLNEKELGKTEADMWWRGGGSRALRE